MKATSLYEKLKLFNINLKSSKLYENVNYSTLPCEVGGYSNERNVSILLMNPYGQDRQ